MICEPIWVFLNATGLFLYLYRSVTHYITRYDVTCTGEVKLSFTETNAAALTARVICKNEKTVRRQRTDLVSNGGAISESNQGRYQRTGVLWANEKVNKKATAYVGANAAVKGKPILMIQFQ